MRGINAFVGGEGWSSRLVGLDSESALLPRAGRTKTMIVEVSVQCGQCCAAALCRAQHERARSWSAVRAIVLLTALFAAAVFAAAATVHVHPPPTTTVFVQELVGGGPMAASSRVLVAMGVSMLPSGAPVISFPSEPSGTSSATATASVPRMAVSSARLAAPRVRSTSSAAAPASIPRMAVSSARLAAPRVRSSAPATVSRRSVQLPLGPGLTPGDAHVPYEPLCKWLKPWLDTTHRLRRMFASARAETRHEARQSAYTARLRRLRYLFGPAAATLIPSGPPLSSHTAGRCWIPMAARRFLLFSAMCTAVASPHLHPTASTTPLATSAPSNDVVMLYVGIAVLLSVTAACLFMLGGDAAGVAAGDDHDESDVEMGVFRRVPCGYFGCPERFDDMKGQRAHHRKDHERKSHNVKRARRSGDAMSDSESDRGNDSESDDDGGSASSSSNSCGSDDDRSSVRSTGTSDSFCSLSSDASIREFDRNSPEALAMNPYDYRATCLLQDSLCKPDFTGDRFRAAYTYVKEHRAELKNHAAFTQLFVSLRKMDTFRGFSSCTCSKKRVTARTARKWMTKAAHILGGNTIKPVTMEYTATIGDDETQSVRGSRLAPRAIVKGALEDPFLTSWDRFLTGQHDRDEAICRKAYGAEMPSGPVVGEPMLTENLRNMCARTVVKFSTRAAKVGATVLPVPLVVSIDGVPPDRGLNKSFVVVQMSLFNWLQPVRATQAAWYTLGIFSSFSVGKGPGAPARRDARYRSMQYFLNEMLTIPLLQELRVGDAGIELPAGTPILEPFIMDTVAGAEGHSFLVVPVFAAATCDYVGACEVCEVNGGACQVCMAKSEDFGAHYPVTSAAPRPRVRDPHEINEAVAALTAAQVPAAVHGMSNADKKKLKRERKQLIAAAKGKLHSLRVHGIVPALQRLVELTWGAPYSVYSRVKATDGLHLWYLGHLKWIHVRLTGHGNTDKEKMFVIVLRNEHSWRVSKGTLFDSGPFRLAMFYGGYANLNSLSGIRGSDFPSLLIRDLAALGVEPGICSSRSASDAENAAHHKLVIEAVEAGIIASRLAHKLWYTPEDILALDEAIKRMLSLNDQVFTPVTSVGVERRPKTHQAAAHVVTDTINDGATINYSTNASEGRNRSAVKGLYHLTNHGDSVIDQMLTLGSIMTFINGPFSLIARVSQSKREDTAPMAPADYADTAAKFPIYRTVPPGCDEKVNPRRHVPEHLLTICKHAFKRWLDQELKDRDKQVVPVTASDKFNADNCFVASRARVIVYPIANCHIVADDLYKNKGGNGLAGERRIGRHDFVEVFDGEGVRDNSVCRLALIVTYRFDAERSGQYVLLHKLTPKLDSPFELLDFHRELPKDKHASYSWLPLETILRPACMLPNFAPRQPPAKYGVQDGWLLARKLQ